MGNSPELEITGVDDPHWQAMSSQERRAYLDAFQQRVDARWAVLDRAAQQLARNASSTPSSTSTSTNSTRDLETLQRVPERTAEILRTKRQEVAAAQRDRNVYQPQVIAQRVQAAQQKARDALAALETEATQARARIEQHRQEAIGKAANSADGGRTLLEQRAWERMRPVLERCSSTGERVARLRELIADAGRQGDVATLRALRTELPAYLEAHEEPALRERRLRTQKSFAEADLTAAQVLADVHTAALPHLSAEERAGYELAEAVKPAAWAVGPNLAWARRELDNPMTPATVLYGWENKSTIPVEVSAADPTAGSGGQQ